MLRVPARWISLSTTAVAVTALCAPGASAGPTASVARVKFCPGFSFGANGGTWKATQVKRTSHITCTRAKNLIRATYGSGPLKVIHTETPTGSHPISWVAGGWRCSFSPTLAQGGHEAFCRNVKHPSWNEVDAMNAVTAIISS